VKHFRSIGALLRLCAGDAAAEALLTLVPISIARFAIMNVSVVIPTYNRAPLLHQTLHSVLDQTRPVDEILVVDDGSTDETAQVVRSFGDRVRYHYQANGNVAAARNKGMALSTGDLICFLDSDDLLLPRALQELESALAAAPTAALAYCRSQTMDAKSRVVDRLWGNEDFVDEVWQPMVDGNFIRSTGCALIRRSHLERVGPWDQALPGAEDWDLWLRLAETAPFVRVEEPLFRYRVHGNQLSHDVFRLRCHTFRIYRKHLARNWNNPPRRRYIGATRLRTRHWIGGAYFHQACEARTGGDHRLAVTHVVRALRFRPSYLFEEAFIFLLRCIARDAWNMRKAVRPRGS
jgi:glycosyltransferase involved in cell wall biosynthesis